MLQLMSFNILLVAQALSDIVATAVSWVVPK